MLLALSLGSFAIMQNTSVLATMPDAQLCTVISRNMAQGQFSNPVAQVSTIADCRAKRIRASVNVALTGVEFTQYLTNYLAVSRAGVCNMDDPTMRAFASRGWKFSYRFRGRGGEDQAVTMDCSA